MSKISRNMNLVIFCIFCTVYKSINSVETTMCDISEDRYHEGNSSIQFIKLIKLNDILQIYLKTIHTIKMICPWYL